MFNKLIITFLTLFVLVAFIFGDYFVAKKNAKNQTEKQSAGQQNLMLVRANNAFAMKNYQQAGRYYSQLMTNTIDDPEVLYQYIRCLLSKSEKDLTLITNTYRRFLKTKNATKQLTPNVVNEMRALGMEGDLKAVLDNVSDPLLRSIIWLDHNIDKAQAQLNVVKETDKGASFYAVSAEIHFLQEQYARVISDTNELLNLGYVQPQAYYHRAQALLRTGQTALANEAMHLYQRLLSLSDKSANERIRSLEQLKQRYPSFENSTILNVRHILDLQKTNQIKKLKQVLKKLSIDQLTWSDQIVLARTVMIDQQSAVMAWLHRQGWSDLSDMLILSDQQLMMAGLMCEYLVKNNQLIDADKVCSVIQADDHDHAPLHYWTAELMIKSKAVDKAIALKHRALDYAPWQRQWRIQLANLFLSQGQVQNARALFDEKIIGGDSMMKKFAFENGLMTHE